MRIGWPLAICLVCCSVAGCRNGSGPTTGVSVTVRFSDDVHLDQLEFTVRGSQASIVVPPTLRPQQPGVVLHSPQSVPIYFPDTLAGTMVTCRVAGLQGGSPLGVAATATVVLQRGTMVSVDMALAAIVPQPNGESCTDPSDCSSTFCVGGICCNSGCAGICQACDLPGNEGTCMPVAAGTPSGGCAPQPASTCGFDGTCDGSGGCQRHQVGVACSVATCAGSLLVPVGACNGEGTCQPAAAVDCMPFTCDPSGFPHCRTSCASDNDCVPGITCANGTCGTRPPQADGAGCLGTADCRSGFCEDGVCCATACRGACQSCNQQGTVGTCTLIAAGKTDPHALCRNMGFATCGTNGLCDGMGECALFPGNTICSAGSCNDTEIVDLMLCDGDGNCIAADQDTNCSPYRCDPETITCFESCTGNAQCATVNGAACDVEANVCQ